MALIKHPTAGSSAFVYLEYEDEEHRVYMVFKDGRSYTIEGFPEIEWHRWTESSSLGGYWNANIRGKYGAPAQR